MNAPNGTCFAKDTSRTCAPRGVLASFAKPAPRRLIRPQDGRPGASSPIIFYQHKRASDGCPFVLVRSAILEAQKSLYLLDFFDCLRATRVQPRFFWQKKRREIPRFIHARSPSAAFGGGTITRLFLTGEACCRSLYPCLRDTHPPLRYSRSGSFRKRRSRC